MLPRTLLDILADGSILKVGVGCSEDASKLLQDYGLAVRGCLDLRYLAVQQRWGVCAYWTRVTLRGRHLGERGLQSLESVRGST